jgi:pilus assembly protein CpaB
MLKGKTPLLIAAVLGILGGALSYTAVKRASAEARKGFAPVPVVVAAQDIPEGTVITYDLLSQRALPEQFVTSSVVKPESANYVIGQKVLVPVQSGDMLLWSQFESSKASERLSSIVQSKGRAISIEVSGAKGSVAGWIRPNDHVDIIGSFREPQTGEQIALTLMQNLLVIATGKLTGTTNVNLLPESQRTYNNVTFLVLPEEAEILSLASDLGSLTLTLRNPNDIDSFQEKGRTTINTLLTGRRYTEVRNDLLRPGVVVYKGTHTEKHTVSGSDTP